MAKAYTKNPGSYPICLWALDPERLDNQRYLQGVLDGLYCQVVNREQLNDPRYKDVQYKEGVEAGEWLWKLFCESTVDHDAQFVAERFESPLSSQAGIKEMQLEHLKKPLLEVAPAAIWPLSESFHLQLGRLTKSGWEPPIRHLALC